MRLPLRRVECPIGIILFLSVNTEVSSRTTFETIHSISVSIILTETFYFVNALLSSLKEGCLRNWEVIEVLRVFTVYMVWKWFFFFYEVLFYFTSGKLVNEVKDILEHKDDATESIVTKISLFIKKCKLFLDGFGSFLFLYFRKVYFTKAS